MKEFHRVILVEDLDFIRSGILMAADWQGHGCMLVGDYDSAEGALDDFPKAKPEIIITDICMLGMTGLELLEKVRSIDDSCIFIMISAYNDFSYAKKALELGAVSYVLKPIDMAEFHNALDKAVGILEREERIAYLSAYVESKDRFEEFMNIEKVISGNSPKQKYLQKAFQIIRDHYSEPISIKTIANDLGISESYLLKLFKTETNYTFLDILTVYRLRQAIALMDNPDLKIYEIAEKVGYRDSRYFSDVFKKYLGKTPSRH